MDARWYSTDIQRFLQPDYYNIAQLHTPMASRHLLLAKSGLTRQDLMMDPSQQMRYGYVGGNQLGKLDWNGLVVDKAAALGVVVHATAGAAIAGGTDALIQIGGNLLDEDKEWNDLDGESIMISAAAAGAVTGPMSGPIAGAAVRTGLLASNPATRKAITTGVNTLGSALVGGVANPATNAVKAAVNGEECTAENSKRDAVLGALFGGFGGLITGQGACNSKLDTFDDLSDGAIKESSSLSFSVNASDVASLFLGGSTGIVPGGDTDSAGTGQCGLLQPVCN